MVVRVKLKNRINSFQTSESEQHYAIGFGSFLPGSQRFPIELVQSLSQDHPPPGRSVGEGSELTYIVDRTEGTRYCRIVSPLPPHPSSPIYQLIQRLLTFWLPAHLL